MIILAAAIILSLSNSGIIGKANKAKIDSDTASLKEYVNTLRAEYELMTADERNRKTFEAYANAKLEENGYKGAAIDVDGKVHSNLTESAKTAIKAGIKVGDKVEGYILTEKSYTTSGEENDGIKQTLKTDTSVTWKYIGIGEDGNLEIVADISATEISKSAAEYKISLLATGGPTEETGTSKKTLTLSGKGGYLNGPAELDKACATLYSVDGKGTAKSMNIDHVTRILGYTGEKGSYLDADGNYVKTAEAMTIGEIEKKLGTELRYRTTPDGKDISTYKSDDYYINKTSDVSKMQNAGNVGLVYGSTEYWLASSSVYADFSNKCTEFYMRYVQLEGVDRFAMFKSFNYWDKFSCAIRPVVSLASNIQIENGRNVGTWVIK